MVTMDLGIYMPSTQKWDWAIYYVLQLMFLLNMFFFKIAHIPHSNFLAWI